VPASDPEEAMRGIISHGAYVPYWRLQRSAIGAAMGSPGGAGTRAVASYDEDTTTMATEAGRLAIRALGGPGAVAVDSLLFATAQPAYLEKTNAAAIHATLRLDGDVMALDTGGAARSGFGTLRAALAGGGTTLVVASDIRTGLPTSADESQGGDGAAALLVGDDADTGGPPVLAEYLGGASATREFLDRWRAPGETRTKAWEERFGEIQYGPLAEQAWEGALKAAGVTADQVDRVVVTGVLPRAVKAAIRKLGIARDALVDDLARTVGHTGTAHPALLLTQALEEAGPDQIIVVLNLADGADAVVLRTTDAVRTFEPARPVATQIATGNDSLAYNKFLSFRGMLTPEPPRRPEPDRISGSAAGRNSDWKFGFVGSRDRQSGAVHLPPARASMKGDAVDDMEPVPMADVAATVVTLTVDRVSYSPSPPIVAAIVDFDGGGRMPVELTDITADELRIGDRVEMTFRRLFTSDGIHNYFWKARPVRTAPDPAAGAPATATDPAAGASGTATATGKEA
jgi:hydroxymethylglutaryl-CoA synthase